jgi:hypothetical protein
MCCYSRLIPHLDARIFMVITFMPRAFICRIHSKGFCVAVCSVLQEKDKKTRNSLLDIQLRYVRFSACILVAVMTELTRPHAHG